ncbi:MAG: hypothetical protein PVF22_07210 [Candidatus Aminicenantes bacterium]|jgi:hypothetical protein
MNSKPRTLSFLLLTVLLTIPSPQLTAQEIFIFRPKLEKDPLFKAQKITVHGEFYGHLQYPSTFPSYNDLSGPEDRWNLGFQNIIHITNSTRFLAQLVTHDDGRRRTKFDWHFSLRQALFKNFVLIFGHDSNHDSDYQSHLGEHRYFLNRNYIGFGLPFEKGSFYVEPFTWFLHNSNQKSYLDLTGEKVRQEYGFRLGYWYQDTLGIHLQIFVQSDSFFAGGQTTTADLIIRIRVFKFLELSLGSRVWKDIQESPLGNKEKYYKLMWGLVVPF